MINLITIRWSFSDWYDATVILASKAHFALTITLYKTPLSYRLLRKCKTCSIIVSLDIPINDFLCLIYILYLVLVLSLNDAFNILTVASLLA